MPTYLEQKITTAGCGIAPIAKMLDMRFSTVALVVRGQMHVTPQVMARIAQAIDEINHERGAV